MLPQALKAILAVLSIISKRQIQDLSGSHINFISFILKPNSLACFQHLFYFIFTMYYFNRFDKNIVILQIIYFYAIVMFI